jgi:hypothetical protein
MGAPKRLEGMKAIGRGSGSAGGAPAPRRAAGAGTLGLVVAAIVGGLAIGMSLLGWF